MAVVSDGLIDRKTIFQEVENETKSKITFVNNKIREILSLKILNEWDFSTELNGVDKQMFTIKY